MRSASVIGIRDETVNGGMDTRPKRPRRRFPPLVPALAAGFTGGLLALIASTQTISQRLVFMLLTVLLLGYSAAEIARVRRVHPDRWLLNPAVVASVLVFCLSFGVGNVLFFLPADTLEIVGLVPDVSPAMVKMMWLVLVGAIGMWLGYWSPLAAGLGRGRYQRAASRWFGRSDVPRRFALPVLVVLSLASRLVQIKLGVFGYSGSHERQVELGSITQYLGMGAALGSVALVVASLRYFADRSRLSSRLWFAAILAVELGFGALSGFKSQMAIPFVIAGVCSYLESGRLPRLWLAGFVASLVLAYAVIEPFRMERATDPSFEGTSMSEILDTFIAAKTHESARPEQGSVWIAMLARSTLTYAGSLGVSYRDEHEELPEGSPEFLGNIFLAPAYAFIPRSIWKSKPVGDLGLWYTQVVVGRDVPSSTAMSPVTYLYFAGGAIAVFVGFFGFGVLYRLLFFLVRPDRGAGRALVYLVLLMNLANVSSAVDGVVVVLCRSLPLAVLLQYVVYARPMRRPHRPIHDTGAEVRGA